MFNCLKTRLVDVRSTICGTYNFINEMASTSAPGDGELKYLFTKIKHFPPVIDGRINVINYLEAASDLVHLVECLGRVFAPVKYDMQGNIDKIHKLYKYDENSCLLELMQHEVSKGKPYAAEGILWLNRALLFFELTFQEILLCLQYNNCDVSMKNIFTVAYEGSVKKYHNWVTQQIFLIICKISPTLPQILKSFGAKKNMKKFKHDLASFNIKLHIVRCKIEDFFKEQNIFDD